MKQTAFALLLAVAAPRLTAQTWDINIGAGFCYTRLIPVKKATQQNVNVRYRFLGPNLYFAPEVCIRINDNSRFSFGYSLSGHETGISIRAGRHQESSEVAYESFMLHNFSVGYYFFRKAFRDRAILGGFGKAGLGFGSNTGGGSGGRGSSAGAGLGSSSVYMQQLNDSALMTDFYFPDITAGITICPILPNPKWSDRLTVVASITLGLRNIYREYGNVHYEVMDQQSVKEGDARYAGLPLIAQFGVSYRLCRFGHSDY